MNRDFDVAAHASDLYEYPYKIGIDPTLCTEQINRKLQKWLKLNMMNRDFNVTTHLPDLYEYPHKIGINPTPSVAWNR